MAYLTIDENGFVVAISSSAHTDPAPGGVLIEVTLGVANAAVHLITTGHRVKLDQTGQPVAVVTETRAAVPRAAVHVVTQEMVKKARREKMQEIGRAAVAGRDRVFPEFPHIHMSGQHRHIDAAVVFCLNLCRILVDKGIVTEDELGAQSMITRHLKSGEMERVTVKSVMEEIARTFYLRQEIRAYEQSTFRNNVNAIFKDANRSLDQKYAEITAIKVPEDLGIDEKKSARVVVVKNG